MSGCRADGSRALPASLRAPGMGGFGSILWTPGNQPVGNGGAWAGNPGATHLDVTELVVLRGHLRDLRGVQQ